MHSVSFPKSPLDKPAELRITVAIGAAVIVQTGLGLIWAGAASERLAQLERRADDNTQIIERTARLEEQVRFVSATLVRIEEKIDARGSE
ncbi:hypothetical protein [Hyphococcus sp.]|uniref:hypothetical protein n=1 Tax=Hyphococcus sp. TaxID=2038636 RepID=UPI0020819185|nr:MAG: hypothetical protein DHS20C04_24290 [Marinicaulis sp.]